jgi:hypothetical protein
VVEREPGSLAERFFERVEIDVLVQRGRVSLPVELEWRISLR